MRLLIKRLSGGIAVMILATFFFAFKPILTRMALDRGLTPESLMTLRLGFAFPLFMITVAVLGRFGELRLTTKELLYIGVVSVTAMGGAMLFSFYSILHLGASISTLVIFIFPAITTVLSYLIYRQPVSSLKKTSLLMSFIGIVFVVLPAYNISVPGDVLKGLAYGLLCAFCWSSTQIAFEKFLKKNSALTTSVYTTGFMLLFIGMFNGVPQTNLDKETWTVVILLATIGWYVPFLLVTYSIKIIGASTASIVQSVGPGMVVLMAWLLLGETITASQFFGMLLLIASVFLLKDEKRVIDAQPEEIGIEQTAALEK